ncbi:hypothetical protein BGZ54_001326 [Gamsiella multidivaricata]|nr:hypothetical protein BGZ54_001326 [Gamsiella multidivaricata]
MSNIGEMASNTFKVERDRNSDVGDLEDKIMAKAQMVFEDIDVNDSVLCTTDDEDHDESSSEERITAAVHDTDRLLNTTATIIKAFQDGGPEDAMHIIAGRSKDPMGALISTLGEVNPMRDLDPTLDEIEKAHLLRVVRALVDGVLQGLAAGPAAADSCACHGVSQGYQHETALVPSLRIAYAGVSNRMVSGVIGITPWRLWTMLNNGRLTKNGSMPAMPDKYYDPVAEMHLRQWFGERRICLIAVAGLEENRWAPGLSGTGCRACGLRRAVLDRTPNAWGVSDTELEAANHASVHKAFMDVLSAGNDLRISCMCDACWLFACKRSMMRPGMMPTAGTVMEALAAMVPPAVRQVRSQAITFAEGAAQLAKHCDDVRFFDLVQGKVVNLSTLMRVSGLSTHGWFYANAYHSVFVSHTWGRYWCKKLNRRFGVDVPHVCNNATERHAVITNVDTMLRSAALTGRRYVWLDWLCVDQDKASPQKALMVALQAALFAVVQFMVVYAHEPQTITSFQLLHDGITHACANTDLKRVADGAWFTSLWTLQELALHKEFMGVISKESSVVPAFSLHAAAVELVRMGSLDFEHALWVCNENLLRTGLSVCVSQTSSVYACAASYRVCQLDDRRAAYSAGLARLPGYEYSDCIGDSAGILASGWITELISAKGGLSEALTTGCYVRSTRAHSLIYHVQSWHTWMAGISAERVSVLGRACSGSLMLGDKPRLKLRAFQNVHGWQPAQDMATLLLSLATVLFLADIGGSKDEADGVTMLCLVLTGLDGHHAFRWTAAIVTVWEAPPGVVTYYEFGGQRQADPTNHLSQAEVLSCNRNELRAGSHMFASGH